MLRVRNRQRLRRREAGELAATLASQFGCTVLDPDEPIDVAEADGHRLVLTGGRPVAILVGDRPVLTVRGAIACKPTKRYVTVDMGAVRFVYNGADVMAPGIVDADPGIAAGDLVWVRDERNLQALAVGEALMAGAEMRVAESGKSVKTIHHVGDEVWALERA